MMLAPRSFLFTRQAPQPKSTKQNTKRREEAQSPATTTTASTQKDESLSARRNVSRDMAHSTASSTAMSIPATSEPVVIPMRSNESMRDGIRRTERKERRHNARNHTERSPQRPRDVHALDSIPPSVAALLALTSIPAQKSRAVASLRASSRKSEDRLTVDAILRHTSVSEKEFSLSLGKSPMDMLLSPPDELDEDETTNSDTGVESSYLSSRTISSESVPSLDDSSIGEDAISLSSITTPSPRRRRGTPSRRMQSMASPPREDVLEHPLSSSELDIDELDFRVFEMPAKENRDIQGVDEMLPRRKSAFKSNLTASLRALRFAARSISSITNPMITPDDFLTRSIISIDPQVPFTDERMPPRLEDIPTPALRRYLNPTTNAPIEAHVPPSLAQTTSAAKCSASIQMQTYRISKATKTTPTNVISRRTTTTDPEEVFQEVTAPVARQRDMRENSDFIRIAVMEMMMRKNGKLDEKMPGRAKWALPPRKPPTKVYEIGEGGVPKRWIPTKL